MRKNAGRSKVRGTVAVMTAALVLLACLIVGPATAMAITGPGAPVGPGWELSSQALPTNFQPGEEKDSLLAIATNVGDTATSGTATVTVELPTEVTFVSAAIRRELSSVGTCGQVGTTVTCTSTTALKPGEQFVVQVVVNVSSTATGTLAGQMSVSGGGVAKGVTIPVSAPVGGNAAPGFAPGSFFSSVSTTQAGAHPNATAGFQLTTTRHEESNGKVLIEPAGRSLREISVETPPGLIGSTMAAPKCTFEQFTVTGCPAASIVGQESIQMSIAGPYSPGGLPLFFNMPIYNLTPPAGVPAEFAFRVFTIVVILKAEVRSGGDYGLTVSVGPNSQGATIFGSSTTFYGVPSRYNGASATPVPFIANPTSCGSPLTTSASATFYQFPGLAPLTAVSAPTTWTGCDRVPFAPSFKLRPQKAEADSPTGVDVDLHLPQNPDAEALMSGAMKEARVQLPPGLVVNPSSAAGLGACAEGQVGLGDPAPAQCPDNAKIGTVEIETPLLDHTMPGSIYVATPHNNPFGTLLAMYITVDDPKTGITLKLPGRIDADPNTGRLTVSVRENPQLPFEDVRMQFFGGPQAALKTPQACGSYTTAAQLVPWGAPETPTANVVDSFTVNRGAGGGCASGEAGEPNQPRFEAGSVLTEAAAESPMVVKISREDGSQRFGALNVELPKGLLARLAGVPYCPDAAIAASAGRSGRDEQANPSCPSASRIGTVQVAAGAGSRPYTVSGNAYLAGPYKGAPISMVVVTPAVAGPFDLGTVVVRTALGVDPITTQVSARSDRLPTILDGIPLDIRSVTVDLDRSSFTRNPTNCEPTSIGGTVFSALGGAASVSNRFQVGSCKALAFEPKLKLQLKGSTKRTGHPALRAVVTYPKEGRYANIGRAQVGLPHSEFLDQGNLNKTCTKPVLLAGHCPKSSVYGYAKAWTPLLDKPLEGNVYLVGGYGYKLPALVAELNGQFRVLLVGRVDSGKNNGVRSTFEVVPDAPVSRFELRMKGGRKYGLLINSENTCRKKQLASALFTAQNGDRLHLRPQITNGCGKKAAPKGKGHRAGK